MSAHHQHASTLAWLDEQHVVENRQLYQRKFAAVENILNSAYTLKQPEGGFYHWLSTPIDEQIFAQGLLEQFNVTVMPGSFLARASGTTNSGQNSGQNAISNPGKNHVRLAWVAELENCVEAAHRLVEYAKRISQT